MYRIKKTFTILTVLLLIAGCVPHQTWEEKYPALAELRKGTRDSMFMMAELEGFRLDMTPRRVMQVMMKRGYKESDLSNKTIEDIIEGQAEHDLLSLESEDGKKGFTLEFCFKRLNEIYVYYDIPTDQYDSYVKNDALRLKNKLQLTENENTDQRVCRRFTYNPNKWSYWAISYYTDFSILKKLHRSERILDDLNCSRRSIGW